MNLPQLPETHDFLCQCCNTVRTTAVCPESEELVEVYAWERGCPAVWCVDSWYDGHSSEINAIEREANEMISHLVMDQIPDEMKFIERFEPITIDGTKGIML